MNNRPDTATVETITAQVRVLMVGSRQVTLSVARQLDSVEPAEIDPFGRVRLGTDQSCEIIGRSKITGALVRSLYPQYSLTPTVLAADIYPVRIRTLRHVDKFALFQLDATSSKNSPTQFRVDSEAIDVDYDEFSRYDSGNPPKKGWSAVDPTGSCDSPFDVVKNVVMRLWDGIKACEELSRAFDSLPLIVLAGLK